MVGQIVVILVVIGVAALVFLWAKAKVAAGDQVVLPQPAAAQPAAPAGPLAGLGVGASVAHEGRDYVVRGEIRFNEEGSVWTEYHLDTDTDVKTWLSVDLSEGTSVAFWEGVAAPDLSPTRGAVTHDGRTYKKVDTGKAAYTTAGTTGLPAVGTAWYADYATEGGRMLGFERWSKDGSWEVSTGVQVAVHQLQVTPARTAAR